MKQKIVTVTKNLKSPSDYQAGFETNIDKWIQAGWQVKQVVSTAFQYQASGIGLVTPVFAVTLLLEKE